MDYIFSFKILLYTTLYLSEGSVFENGGDEGLEYNLVESLLSKYNPQIRPMEKSGDVTYVFVELSLFNILDLNTKEEVLKTNTEFIMKWIDPNLRWDPSGFGNISLIRIPQNRIWLPDVVLYNTAEEGYESGLLASNVIVEHNGVVELVVHALFASVCNVDVEFYPFDQQICTMKFASWSFDERELKLVHGRADLSEFRESPEFTMEDFYADQTTTFNPCCLYNMSTLLFRIHIQRRTVYSLFFFILPGILINICAIFVFSLPAESGEKIVLGISSMIAMIVFLMEMTLRLPATEKIPLVGLYYGACFTLITLNIGLSVLMMNLNLAGERKRHMPKWLRKTTLFLVPIFGIRIPEIVREKWRIAEDNSKHLTKVSPLNSHQEMIKNAMKVNWRRTNKTFKDPYERRMIGSLEKIVQKMKYFDRSNEIAENNEVEIQEWKFVSRVFDRFLFILFTVVCLVLDLILLIISPSSKQFK